MRPGTPRYRTAGRYAWNFVPSLNFTTARFRILALGLRFRESELDFVCAGTKVD